MASTETLNVLKIDAGQAITTLRELKEAIANDRDALVALGNAEEYTADKREKAAVITARLTKENQLLRQVMTASKGMSLDAAKAVNIQTASYYDLNAALVTLRKEWKNLTAAERQEASGQEILQKIQAVDAELKQLDASIGQYQRNVGDYANQFKIALGGIQKTANGLMTGMAGIAGVIALTGGESEKATKALAGLQAGMMLLTSAKGIGDVITEGNKAADAINAIGGASKATTAATEAQTAATEGLTGAVEAETAATVKATAATQVFKKVLITTGIGAIIVAIGALIAHLEDLKDLFYPSAKEAKKACDSMVADLERVSAAMEDQVKTFEAGGALKEETMLKEVQTLITLTEKWKDYEVAVAEAYGVKSDEFQKALDGVKEKVNALKEKLQEAKYGVIAFASAVEMKEAQKGMTSVEKAIDGIHRQANAMRETLGAAFEQGVIGAAEYLTLLGRLREAEALAVQQAQEEAAKATQEAVRQEKERAEKIAAAAADARKSEKERLTEKYQEDLALLQKHGLDITDLVQKYNDDIYAIEQKEWEEERKAREAELADEERDRKAAADAAIKEARRKADGVLDALDRETDAALRYNDASELGEREKADKEYEITKAANEKKLEELKRFKEEAEALDDKDAVLSYDQEIADLEVEIEVAAYEEKHRIRERDKKERIAAAKATLSSMSSILGSIADMEETNGKNDEKAKKRAKNLRIAAATVDMFQGAVTAYSSAMELGPIMGPIVGAINSAAVIAAGIANISKIKSTDVSGDSSSSTASSATAPAPVVTPEITEVRTLTGAAEEERLNQPVRVYILSSDIEALVNDSKVKVAETTF